MGNMSAQQKGKQKLTDAFLQLYQMKSMSEITISATCKIAGYNRCTFYNYYDDAQSLLAEAENQTLALVEGKMAELLKAGIPDDINTAFGYAISLYDEYVERVYLLLNGSNGNLSKQKLKKLLEETLKHISNQRMPEEYAGYLFSFATSALVGLFEEWYRSKKALSKEKFIDLACSLVLKGTTSVILKDADGR